MRGALICTLSVFLLALMSASSAQAKALLISKGAVLLLEPSRIAFNRGDQCKPKEGVTFIVAGRMMVGHHTRKKICEETTLLPVSTEDGPLGYIVDDRKNYWTVEEIPYVQPERPWYKYFSALPHRDLALLTQNEDIWGNSPLCITGPALYPILEPLDGQLTVVRVLNPIASDCETPLQKPYIDVPLRNSGFQRISIGELSNAALAELNEQFMTRHRTYLDKITVVQCISGQEQAQFGTTEEYRVKVKAILESKLNSLAVEWRASIELESALSFGATRTTIFREGISVEHLFYVVEETGRVETLHFTKECRPGGALGRFTYAS